MPSLQNLVLFKEASYKTEQDKCQNSKKWNKNSFSLKDATNKIFFLKKKKKGKPLKHHLFLKRL
jgi:hypothetical protein